MKKFILTAFAVCLSTIATFGQAKTQITPKDKEAKKTVVAGTAEYANLKAKGLLNDYEIKPTTLIFDSKKLTPANRTSNTTVTTPCEFPPVIGPPAFTFS